MHVLFTGSDCLANEHFPVTMVRLTIKVFYLFNYCFFGSFHREMSGSEELSTEL